jgi:protein-arginine kinase
MFKIILFLTLLAYKKATTDTAIKNGDDISDVDEVNDIFSTNDEDHF